jgi:glutamate N-acetyltransferase / amino-acid N-acetyltransferase
LTTRRPGTDAGAISAPLGFRASAVAAGIKPDRLDLAVVAADAPCAAAGVFTSNLAVAAPVVVCREHLATGRARAIVVNAGCANAATGASGLHDAHEMAERTASALGCAATDVLVASTGVIGLPLPMDKVRTGIAAAARALSRDSGADVARAILTTDTRPKEVLVETALGGRRASVGGIAKGAGMIAPNMATLLAFFTTDAAVKPAVLRAALVAAVGETLNRITVDGDTSTNDTALILASGASGAPEIGGPGPDHDAFCAALTAAARRLAEMVVRDGEGATRVAEVRVEGAATPRDADVVARTVAESPLVKTALHGGDPNWGRILAAVGRSGIAIGAGGVDIHLGEVKVAAASAGLRYDEEAAHGQMLADPVRIRVVLHEGTASGWMWTCDFSHEYVDINAHYRT